MLLAEIIKNNGYEVLTSVLLANVSAQVVKTIIYSSIRKRIMWHMLINTGGMPSSHSSSIVALACSTGLIAGFNSVEFAIALTMSAVVMYDSAGIRRSAGRQAAALNKMIHELPDGHDLKEVSLKELLGHSPREVIAGAVLGVAISLAVHLISV